jgi:hypothetical protein
MDTNNKIKKCIKSYLCGRKNIKNNHDKALDYFYKTLLIHKDICIKSDIDEGKQSILDEIYNKTNKYILALKGSLFYLIDLNSL